MRSVYVLCLRGATSFLIPDFNKNIFICRSSHFIKRFKITVLVSVYPKSPLLENLYIYVYMYICTYVYIVFAVYLKNGLNMSWRYTEYVFARGHEDDLKRSWRRVTKTNIFVLIKTWWKSLEDVFWRRITKANIFVLIKMSRRRPQKRKATDAGFNLTTRSILRF